ncbi:glutathione S-transferase N-terminal domain-containing protein [Hahella ganghwensis]|uniref:glutathione S-transferase N-terminal domain-containing protein n=1 Tax=Hahella ganghwensis TaxID=286420 RepID=UPI00035FA6FC|nr:glutathione S-transferase N-terminal domain-containing protein [Hahella ganghwensis]
MFPNSHIRNVINSTLASTTRFWRGTSGSKKTQQPEHLPELYDREGCPKCRLVREALTELNLDAMIYPCPEGGSRFAEKLESLSGDCSVPFLVDPNTETRISGAQEIIEYLFLEYRGSEPPKQISETALNLVSSHLTTWVRGLKGTQVKASLAPSKPLTLYSFESSPFSRPVRERLCELEIPYRLINLSKQQWADMGPAGHRLHLGKYRPLPGSKRELFLQQHGEVQVPYLVDPNHQTELFESVRILRYLDDYYARSSSSE